MNILVGITGSVATLKLPELIDAIMRHFPESHLKVVATERSLHFVHVESFTKKYPHIPLLRDANEWSCWQQRGDPVLHIEVSGQVPRYLRFVASSFFTIATQVGRCSDCRSAGC